MLVFLRSMPPSPPPPHMRTHILPVALLRFPCPSLRCRNVFIFTGERRSPVLNGISIVLQKMELSQLNLSLPNPASRAGTVPVYLVFWWCGAVRCGAVRCGAVRCGAVRCGAVCTVV